MLTSLWAQDQSATPPATTPSQPAAQQAAGSQEKDKSADRSKTKGTQKKTSNDRLFFALPNFLTLENGSNAPPLTAAEKFKVTARDTFDPVEFAWYGLQAGISQARDHANYLYGQGMRGFGERFGVVFGDGTIENFFTKAIFPSVLHQDPRYFQKGKGGFWRRASYAVSRVFITRSDSGQTEVNFSELIGSATAAGISAYTYHPHSDRNVGGVIDTWGTQVGFDALSYTLKEFWPDLRRKMSHTPPANTAR
ncbi:MAG TPA: hypothetical protein VMB03_21205 [Bryobacteraceae bacterium]|nr:hypothetical protein [Bryobacteraceae bacterium]